MARPDIVQLYTLNCAKVRPTIWPNLYVQQWRTQNFRMGGVKVTQAPGGVGRGILLPRWAKGLGRGLCPLSRKFCVFLLKIPYFDAFWHVHFLNRTPMWGVLTPLTPSSVRHSCSVRPSGISAVEWCYIVHNCNPDTTNLHHVASSENASVLACVCVKCLTQLSVPASQWIL